MAPQDWQGGGKRRPASPSSKADWRKKPPAAGAAGAKAAASWQQKPGRVYEEQRRWRWVRIAGGCLIALTLTVLLIWYITRRPIRTPMVALAITDYGASEDTGLFTVLPPNPWAAEDIDRFRYLDNQAIVHYASFAHDAHAAKEAGFEELARGLKRAAAEGRPDLPLIVYLSAHGMVDAHGAPCVILPVSRSVRAAQGNTPGEWFPLRDLLQNLFSGELATSKRLKLLILDAARIDHDWRMGITYNGFADRLPDMYRDLSGTIPGLVILSSAGPGQVAWSSPEQLHQSVFGYFVRQGLLGAADQRSEGGDGDGEVQLGELYRYVKRQTAQWVLENRAGLQEPVLLAADPEASNAFLVHAKKPHLLEALPQLDPQSAAVWDRIAPYWQRHDALRRRRVFLAQPLLWEAFQRTLLRFEQLALAGSAYRVACESLELYLDRWARELDATAELPAIPAFSLPLAEAFASPRLAEEQAVLRKAWKPESRRFELEPNQKVSYLAAAAEAWRLCRGPLRSDAWPDLLDFLDKTGGAPRADVVEVHFLRMLQAYLDPPVLDGRFPLVARSLATRQAAEQAAALMWPDAQENLPRSGSTTDYRAHYWARGPIEVADQQRRQAEDQLFVGGKDDCDEAEAHFEQTQGYAEGRAVAERVGQAYALRDEVWATAPYLAAWLFDRLQSPQPDMISKCRDLVRQTQQLSDELEKSLERGEFPASLQQRRAAVDRDYQELQKAFRGRCSYLLESAGADPATLREIQVVLAGPLVTGQQRNRLREKYLQILGVPLRPGEQTRRNPGLEAPPPKLDHYLERFHGPNAPDPQTFLGITLSTESSTGKLESRVLDAATGGKEFRAELAKVRLRVSDALDQTRAALQAGEMNPAKVRGGRSLADRHLRQAAALVDFDNPEKWPKPAEELRRLDLGYFLVWQAHRAVDDFWGPRPGLDGPPYFQAVAQAYLKAATGLGVPADPADAGKKLNLLLTQRLETAKSLVRLQATDLQIDPADASAPGHLEATAAADLPTGFLALWVCDPQQARAENGTLLLVTTGPTGSTQRRRVELPVGPKASSTTVNYVVSRDQPLLKQGRLELDAVYRGHLRSRPFVAEETKAGLTIEFRPPPYQPPVILVKGSAALGFPIIFILDLSGSMTTEQPAPQADGTTQMVPRYQLAESALLKVLERLSKADGLYEVGIRVYGHRVGWEEDADGRRTGKLITWDPNRPGKTMYTPAGFPWTPRNDIEKIYDLGPFRAFDYEQVKTIFRSLGPLGETPLYAAIKEAIGDLNKRKPSAAEEQPQRRIVALTDGVNEVSDDKGFWVPSSLSDLLAAFAETANQDIRLDILGFNIQPEDFTQRFAKVSEPYRTQYINDLLNRFQELKDLPGRTGDDRRGHGQFYPFFNPDQLIQALEHSLQLRQYQVERLSDSTQMSPRGIDLNTALTIRQSPRTKVAYRVSILDAKRPASAQVELEGGEAIAFYLSADGRRLEHHRYLANLRAAQDDIEDPQDPLDRARRSFVGLHMADWADDYHSAVFALSIQNNDPTQFSPRPAEAWIQVRPILEGGRRGPTYNFYDLAFVPDRPVPELTCKAAEWPVEARKAEIQLWFKRQPTLPTDALTLGDWKRQGGQLRSRQIPNVSFTVQTRRPSADSSDLWVQISEKHEDGPTFDAVRVTIDPPPARIQRQYNEKAQSVRHTFVYPSTDVAASDGFTVQFTPRERLRERAIAPKPFLVDLPPR